MLVSKFEKLDKSSHIAAEFIKKWSGFLKEENNEYSKYNYLMDKYK